MRSITPFSFISFFVSLFKLEDPPLTQALKASATEIIIKAQNEVKLLEFKPSIIAASALLSASHELFPLQYPCFRKEISECPFVNKGKMLECFNIVEEMVKSGYESVLNMVPSSDTPVNVLDYHLSPSPSSSSESEEITITANGRAERRDGKRRKISGVLLQQ